MLQINSNGNGVYVYNLHGPEIYATDGTAAALLGVSLKTFRLALAEVGGADLRYAIPYTTQTVSCVSPETFSKVFAKVNSTESKNFSVARLTNLFVEFCGSAN
jgi:hypothetical protein